MRCRGFEVYDCDSEARLLMDGSASLKSDIAARLGADCIDGDGRPDRERMAACVFSDAGALAWLNARVHALVRADIERRVCMCMGRVFFVESAILHTSGLDRLCGQVWIVEAPERLRLLRACGRDNAEESKIRVRMKAQARELGALACEDVRYIRNSGVESLLCQIDNLTKNI